MSIAVPLLVVALLTIGWAAAVVFQSPSQVEASRQPPTDVAVTAEVTLGDLSRTISVAMGLGWQSVAEVPFTVAAGKEVVTAAPVQAGEKVSNFSVLAEVNGGPRFIVEGDFPFYRDLTTGDEGPDVAQFQSALRDAGHPVRVDGKFGPQTLRAFQSAYMNAGYGKPAAVVTASELMVAPELPAVIVGAPHLGTILDDATTISLGVGSVVASSEVGAATATTLAAGMTAEFTRADGVVGGGKITRVTEVSPEGLSDAEPVSGAEADNGERWSVVIAADEPFTPDVVGMSLVAVINVEVSAENSLLVPTVAVVPNGAGNPHVLVLQPDGTTKEVEIREVATLNGQSAVEPVIAKSLAIGDRVKVD